MVGKLFLAALLCVAVAQGQEEYADDVRSALQRLRSLRASVDKRVEGIVSSVQYKKKSINIRTDEYINREERLEEELLRTMENVALELEEKVGNNPSVLECIEQARSTASENIRTLGPKFVEDMRRLQRTKLENIETACNPFATIRKNIASKYNTAVTDIRRAKTPTRVRQVLTRVTREFDALYAEARRVQNNISTMYTNFQRDANTFFQNVNRQATRMQTYGIRKMRECVHGKIF